MFEGLRETFLLLFTFPKTPARVSRTVNEAWDFAAAYLGIDDPGYPPPVVLRPTSWNVGGQAVIGRYNVLQIFGWVLKERITLLDAGNLFENMAHESAHSLAARNGLPLGEVTPERVERAALYR